MRANGETQTSTLLSLVDKYPYRLMSKYGKKVRSKTIFDK